MPAKLYIKDPGHLVPILEKLDPQDAWQVVSYITRLEPRVSLHEDMKKFIASKPMVAEAVKRLGPMNEPEIVWSK